MIDEIAPFRNHYIIITDRRILHKIFSDKTSFVEKTNFANFEDLKIGKEGISSN